MKKTYYSILHTLAILTLAVILFILPTTAMAEEDVSVSYNNNTKTITIIADISDKSNAAAMIVVSKDAENTFVNAIRTDANGVVNHIETMPASFDGGRYNIQVSSKNKVLTGYFIYPVDSTIESALPILNSKTSASELCDAIVASSGELAVDMLIFEPVKTEASKIMFALRPSGGWTTASGFLNSYNNALAAVEFKNGIAPDTVLAKYGAALDMNVAVYNSLTEEEKTLLKTYLTDADYTLATTKTIFYEGKAVSQLRASDNWAEMRDNAILNSDVLGFDMTYYNMLKDKDSAYMAMFDNFIGTESIKEIRALFYNSSKTCYSDENKPTQNTNQNTVSGGFSGSVSYTPAPVTPVPDEDKIGLSGVEFSDTSNHWGKDAINYLAGKEIITGFEDGTFKPDNKVTRAEFTTMVVRALGISGSGSAAFSDVASDSWYSQSIGAAVSAGIINGMPDGSFSPESFIKREDAFLILYRAFGNKLNRDEAVNFVDLSDASSYTIDAIVALSASGIVSGDDLGRINPLNNTSRAEVATLLMRIVTIGKE